MPEGPENRHQTNFIRQRLNEDFISKSKTSPLIIGIAWDSGSRYHYREELKGLDLCKLPMKIVKMFSRGKLMIWECLNGDGKKLYIVNHLGMTGRWIYSDTKDGLGSEKHSNLWITFGKESAKHKGFYETVSVLYFNDYRKMGFVEITESLEGYFKKNGPCLMTAALIEKGDLNANDADTDYATIDIWNKCVSNNRLKNKNIGEFLMEQKYVSGIGNYLRAEILYRCKISPFRELKDITETEKKTLYKVIIDTIYESYIKQGPKNGYIETGDFYLYCYERSEDDYGNPIYKESDSKNRTIHYCPNVQL